MLKGTLEGSILTIIGSGETYGYEISQQLQQFGFGNISEGTIYPLLLRLEKNGLISAVFRQSSHGPKRKYYSLTIKGKEEIKAFSRSFEELEKAVNNLLRACREDYHHE